MRDGRRDRKEMRREIPGSQENPIRFDQTLVGLRWSLMRGVMIYTTNAQDKECAGPERRYPRRMVTTGRQLCSPRRHPLERRIE